MSQQEEKIYRLGEKVEVRMSEGWRRLEFVEYGIFDSCRCKHLDLNVFFDTSINNVRKIKDNPNRSFKYRGKKNR